VHREQNAPMHGLQAVADIRQRAAHDHAHGVIEIALLHLVGDRDRLDVAAEMRLVRAFGVVSSKALGVSLPAFRIAGGLLLFWISFEMVFERRNERKQATAETAITQDHIRNVAAFPLAIPLMAGPGALTAMMLLAGRAGGDPLMLVALAVICGLVVLSCLIVFLLAVPIARLLGITGNVVLTRLLGVILAALAVQFVIDGVKAVVRAA
jgi:multiple antibiotic resistance protein